MVEDDNSFVLIKSDLDSANGANDKTKPSRKMIYKNNAMKMAV
jgi:hypothetical protein